MEEFKNEFVKDLWNCIDKKIDQDCMHTESADLVIKNVALDVMNVLCELCFENLSILQAMEVIYQTAAAHGKVNYESKKEKQCND